MEEENSLVVNVIHFAFLFLKYTLPIIERSTTSKRKNDYEDFIDFHVFTHISILQYNK